MTALPRCTPEKQGVSSDALNIFFDDIEKNIQHLHSFMLLRHGHVICEAWLHPWQADDKHMLFSLSKSFTSTAIGFAISEGLFNISDRIVDIFPAELPADISNNLAEMQIRHLLTMSTGHHEDTTDHIVYESDPIKAFLALPVTHKPGTHFVYNSGATFMLSHIITRFTGQRLLEYLESRLFQPLEINAARWDCHPNGVDFGGWGLSIGTEDIARFGQLYLQKGKWEGKQLLPENWVKEAGKFQIDNSPSENPDWSQGYGYQFWRCCPAEVYRGDGAFGQFCIIMPEQDAVIAITAGVQNMQSVLAKIWEHILPALKKNQTASDEKNPQYLSQMIRKMQILPLIQNYSVENERKFGNQTFNFGENDFFLHSIQLDFVENRLNYQAAFPHSNLQELTFKFGRGAWVYDHSILADRRLYKAAISGSWVEDNVFQLCICHIEMPFITNMFISFNNDKVFIQFKYNVSFGPLESEVFSSL